MPPGTAVLWAPEDLPIDKAELGSWAYVVLEEIVDDLALLRSWPWPVVDPLGRLLWPGKAELETDSVAVSIGLLQAQLYTTANNIKRQPRCGDTFAVPGASVRRWPRRRVIDLRAVFGEGAVYDISADAREAVKIAYQASLAAIGPADESDPAQAAGVARVLDRVDAPLPPLSVGPAPAAP